MQSLTKSGQQGLEKVQLKPTEDLTQAMSNQPLQLLLNLNEQTAIDFYKHQSTLTLKQAVSGERIIAQDEEQVWNGLLNLLKSLEVSMNIREKLDDAQAFEIVVELTREFKGLTIDEFIYCFRKAKLGHYGKDYNRMDILSISLWLREYTASNERIEAIKSLENKNKWREYEEQASQPPPEFYEKLNATIKKTADKLKANMIKSKGFAQSDFHKELREKIFEYSDEEINLLREDAIDKKDLESLEIIDIELKSRS